MQPTETPRAQRIQLRTGIEIEYDDVGSGDRALVLVHGFTGSREDWTEQLPHLAALGRTLTLDLRGHGGSTKTGRRRTYTLDQLAEDLEAFRCELGLGEWDLLGHSLGGMVVLRYALRWPDALGSLILMNTSSSGVPLTSRPVLEGGARLARLAGMGALAMILREGERREPRLAPAARDFLERIGEDVFWDRMRRRLDAMEPASFVALGLELSQQQPLTERLREIRCPTSVLVGEQDEAFLEPARVLSKEIPGCRTTVFRDAAHSAQLETPEVWLQTIRDHLAWVRG